MSEEIDSTGMEPIAHHNVVVLTASKEAEMDRIVSMPSLRGLVWHRLNATTALVDPTALVLLWERLEAAGLSASAFDLRRD